MLEAVSRDVLDGDDIIVDDREACEDVTVDDAEAVDVDGPGLLVGETNAAAQRK